MVNYDLPFQPEEYIHRIGRTGRAGSQGEAVSFVAWGDFKNLCAIESRLNHIIERKEIEGFVVRKTVPISILNYVPKNKKVNKTGGKSAAKGKLKDKPKKEAAVNNKSANQKNKHIWG